MLSITNEVDPLFFHCVCFVCDTNMCFSNKDNLLYRAYWWFWSMRKSLMGLGEILTYEEVFTTHWGTFVDSTHEEVLSTPWENFLHNSPGSTFVPRTIGGSPSMILYFTRDLVNGLNSRRSFLGDFWSTEGYSWSFQSIWGCFGGPCVFYLTEGIFVIFGLFVNFLLHFLPYKNPLGIFEFFFYYTTRSLMGRPKLHVV